MPLRGALARLRELSARLIARQHGEDAHPGTSFEQERDSDRTFLEASAIHNELLDRADDIEARLADVRRDVTLALLARWHEKGGDT